MTMKLEAAKKALEALPNLGVAVTEYAKKGFHLDVKLKPDQLVKAVKALDREGFLLETITGVDWLGEKAARIKQAKDKAAALAKAKAKAAADAGEAPPEEVPPPPPDPKDQGPDDMEAVYDFSRFDELCRVVLRVRTPRDNPKVPTIVDIYPVAHWHERETHDFFGIVFEGHPYLVPLLLPEDADFHPLRKDYRP